MSAVRKIEPKLVAYIDKKLEGNGLAKDAIARKDARLLFSLAAQACVGIREKSGKNDGPMVELIQETIGGHDAEPWCASFVMTCLAYAEVKTGIKSPLVATESSRECWTENSAALRVKYLPLPGAIAVWADIGKFTGHVEIVLSADEHSWHGVGGNTSGTTDPKSQVNRDGNGVFYTVRNYEATASRRLLGFIKPFA